MSLARRFVKALLLPVRRVLDPRFHDLAHRIFEIRQEIGSLHTNVNALNTRVTDVDAVVREASATHVETVTMVGQELRPVTSELAVLGQNIESLLRDVNGIGQQMSLYRDQVQALTGVEQERVWLERLGRLTDGGRLDQLDAPAAQLLNYAASHRGFAAQADLWMNPPLVFEHVEGGVRLAHVNERVVEVPFTLRALGDVPLGGRILDFGASESTFALSLATMGYAVTALDLRPYPFEHSNLTSLAVPLEEFSAPDDSFAAITVISTVEHVGLGWYGEQPGQFDDLRAMARLRELLMPGGTLVLTVPYGAAAVDEVQRRYDHAGLDALLEGFDEVERLVVEQAADTRWEPVPDSTAHAVALVRARLPAS